MSHARQPLQMITKATGKTYVLAIYPLLAIDLEVPCKRSLKERLVLGLGQVQPLVLIGLPVGSNLDDRLDLLPARDEQRINAMRRGTCILEQGVSR